MIYLSSHPEIKSMLQHRTQGGSKNPYGNACRIWNFSRPLASVTLSVNGTGLLGLFGNTSQFARVIYIVEKAKEPAMERRLSQCQCQAAPHLHNNTLACAVMRKKLTKVVSDVVIAWHSATNDRLGVMCSLHMSCGSLERAWEPVYWCVIVCPA